MLIFKIQLNSRYKSFFINQFLCNQVRSTEKTSLKIRAMKRQSADNYSGKKLQKSYNKTL